MPRDSSRIAKAASARITRTLKVEAKLRRARKALRLIAWPGKCERDTRGIGMCYGNGKSETAAYTADRVCDTCIAHRALRETR